MPGPRSGPHSETRRGAPRAGRPQTFAERVAVGGGALHGLSIDTVQVNVGLRCNLACRHCHVESGPNRGEAMDEGTMRAVLDAARRAGAGTLDVTGGAPELHPAFRSFVDAALAQGLRVLVRTNLTVMLEPGYQDLPGWFAARDVHLVASLPCYLEDNVDRQRGRHVHRGSIEVLRRLNACGYGVADPAREGAAGEDPAGDGTAGRRLDLVYNPGGATLPGDQRELERSYRRELRERHGVVFSRLLALANLPIGRFLDDLLRDGKAEPYLELLRTAFNPATVEGLMCRHQLHVGCDGRLFDCDFNFALGLPVRTPAQHVADFDPVEFRARTIAVGEHCHGCTAGAGSSCGGALT